MRSRYRCSMCPAIHINSRSWLRSSSTHEPSDPPPKVVSFSVVQLFPRGKGRWRGSSRGSLGLPSGAPPRASAFGFSKGFIATYHEKKERVEKKRGGPLPSAGGSSNLRRPIPSPRRSKFFRGDESLLRFFASAQQTGARVRVGRRRTNKASPRLPLSDLPAAPKSRELDIPTGQVPQSHTLSGAEPAKAFNR